MHTLSFHKNFSKSFKKLPQNIQTKTIELEEIIKENPFHPLLKSKKLSGKLSMFYSMRVTREYRILFQIEEKLIIFYEAGHRKDIYE